jgi:hypothetical protein
MSEESENQNILEGETHVDIDPETVKTTEGRDSKQVPHK